MIDPSFYFCTSHFLGLLGALIGKYYVCYLHHITRRPPAAPIRRCLDMQVSVGRRQRGRPLKTWIKAVKEDILDLEIKDGLWGDRVAWRARIHVADPDYVGNVL